ncbi:MAG: hypothetical protein HY455_00475 [Parcubacteria group bacterium]|nr:hypothetical protein [Parcubacteria group bacterium]
MSPTLYKKITYGKQAILTLVFLGVLFSSMFASFGTVEAQGVEPGGTNSGPITIQGQRPGEDNPLPDCGVTKISGCLVQLTSLIFKLSTLVLHLVGNVFNYAIAFSLSSQVIDSEFAREGWKIVRDLANLTFIFILLYIAFATMLQMGGVNMRTALANLIVVALLINFSLFFTRVVIDAGNTLAFAFYNSFEITGATQKYIGGVPVKNISDALVAGFDPQTLFADESFAKWKDSASGHIGMAFVFISASVIVFMFAWALFTASAIFLIRVPVLWLLMIAAPAAFAAWIVPGMRGKSNEWWSTLWKQSVVVALFLFFLYLIVHFIVDTPFFDSVGITSTPANGSLGDELNDLILLILGVLFKFAVLYILIKMAVSYAQSLSGEAGKIATNWSGKAIGFATGAASGGAGFVFKRPLAAIGTAFVAEAARAAEGFQKADKGVTGRIAGTLRRIPVLGTATTKALGRVGARAETDIQKMEAELKALSDDAVKNVAASTLSGTRRAAAVRLLAQKGNLSAARDFNADDVTQAIAELKSRNISTKPIEGLRWQYSTTPAERAHPDTIRTVTPATVEKLNGSWFTDPTVTAAMFRQFHGGHVRAILEHNDAAVPTGFFDQLSSMMYTDPVFGPRPVGRSLSNVKTYLSAIGNKRLSTWAQSREGSNTLRAHGFA